MCTGVLPFLSCIPKICVKAFSVAVCAHRLSWFGAPDIDLSTDALILHARHLSVQRREGDSQERECVIDGKFKFTCGSG